ncbi:hypothetical protein GcC1_151009 [Golovinomyces cichoracearum]|uniref:Uncharacterized protein n=1 Tax=Golovinomyces cichoracearum TaxID=62708 RepID=A0A420HX33_9PEZI|nr:hypothetical protein GcC1_151009 [Golovinomyces cichoracearum]
MRCLYILHFLAVSRENSHLVSSSNLARIEKVHPAFIYYNKIEAISYVGKEIIRSELKSSVGELARGLKAEIKWDGNDPSKLCVEDSSFRKIIQRVGKMSLIFGKRNLINFPLLLD